jgi:hypothetical protein
LHPQAGAAGAQHVGAAGAQQVGSGAQHELHRLCFLKLKSRFRKQGFLQQGLQQDSTGAQHVGAAGAQHVGAAGAQQVGSQQELQRLCLLNLKIRFRKQGLLQQGLQQDSTGAQQVGSGAQQVGSGAQHVGSEQQLEQLLCFIKPNSPASAEFALTLQTIMAAVKVNHFIPNISSFMNFFLIRNSN